MENVLAPNELLTHVILPAPGSSEERALRSALQGIARLADCVRHRAADDEWRHRTVGARRDGRGGADPVALARRPSRRSPARQSMKRLRPPRPTPP